MAFREFKIIPAHINQRAKTVNGQIMEQLLHFAKSDVNTLYNELQTNLTGLTSDQAEEKRDRFGPNSVLQAKTTGFFKRLWDNVKNPLVILLVVLGIVSLLTGDSSGAVVIGVMVVLGVVLRFIQESRADHAAEELQAMVSTTASALRDGKKVELPLDEIVPGDIVFLSAGDMIPADVRILTAKDLFVNQAALTGESYPVEKDDRPATPGTQNPLEVSCLGYLGTDVESGTAMALVLATGASTYFGSLASKLTSKRQPTNFDNGINNFTMLMIGFMAVMVPLVFLFNGLSKHNWLEALLFALAVAVGLTPEMLPMIVTVNLSNGAISMSKKKVIVKKLDAIQNFGAMDVLCTDKTGTITEGRIVLEKHIDVSGTENFEILEMAYLNSYYQTGLKNLMDMAILEHAELKGHTGYLENYQKVDEIPFDFRRKRMSVVIKDTDGRKTLITKGAIEEVLDVCTHVEVKGEVLGRLPEFDAKRKKMIDDLNGQGFRVIALAYKSMPADNTQAVFGIPDEADLTLKGFLAFLDPPKKTASQAIASLKAAHVDVKILTGDNDLVTQTVCNDMGLSVGDILLGPAIEKMSDEELAEATEGTTIFAKLSPDHKERIIKALRWKGHVVGFMGDGINDAPALRAADVGISVNTAVDIAKESSDIILLENSLLVLEEGVIEGRRVFGNIIKYIRMAASSNFGNMFSVLGASIFLPFVPMLPIQVLTNNLLYDFSQTAIPSDSVDPEWLERPRKWAIGELRRFILFIGPISSIFDYLTFFLMLYVFKAWTNADLFHTGWFIESLFTQTLIIHVIRTHKVPFIESRASRPLLITSLIIVAIGAYLPYSPLASVLGFVPLPPLYWLFLLAMLVCYVFLTQFIKKWFFKRFGD
jgi:Mg2+-importing ATPase